MNMDIVDIVWGAQENLFYVTAIVIIVLVVLLYKIFRLRHVYKVLVPTKNVRSFLCNCSMPRMVLKMVLLFVATVFLGVALLRPMWNKKEEVIEQEGRDLFIALDISRSMLATDCKPNRLAVAKEKIKKLLPLLQSERIGLILFSGSSIMQCPLTTDYDVFMMFLDAIDVDTVSAGTTALDQAITKAVESFAQIKDRKNKLLIIFTDGEDFSSNLADVKHEAIAQGMHIFTVGVGTSEGAPIPLYDAYGEQIGHQKDDNGAIVISRLNEGILRAVAQDSGSIYVPITQDDSDIHSLVRVVKSFEKEKLEDKKIAMMEDQYHYFLLVSFICLLLEWIM